LAKALDNPSKVKGLAVAAVIVVEIGVDFAYRDLTYTDTLRLAGNLGIKPVTALYI
jgi:hypothetical protein